MVPSPTSYGLPFPKIGGLELSYILLSHKQEKLRTSNLAGTFTGLIQVKAHSKFRRKWSVSVSRDCPIFLVPPIISGTGKATDFTFGRYIYRAYPNKSPLEILEKRERARVQGLTKFSRYPLLSQERVKLRTSNFVGTFIGPIGTKAHENVGNCGRGRSQGVQKFFRAHICRAHCAVIFAIAQLSCNNSFTVAFWDELQK